MKAGWLLAALLPAALLLAPSAVACTEAEPCVLRATLDDGLWFDVPGDNATTVAAGWYLLDVFNKDEASHALRLENQTFTATGYADAAGPRSRHGPVELAVGAHDLTDETTGDAGHITVEPAAPTAPTPPGTSEPTEPEPTPEPGAGPGPGPDSETTEPTGPEPVPEARKDVPGVGVGALVASLAALGLLARSPPARRD